MDPQGSRDGRMGGSGRSQWHDGAPTRSQLRLAALLFVPGLAGFFALAYFGWPGDRQRGDLIGSLVDAAGLAALVTALTTWCAIPG